MRNPFDMEEGAQAPSNEAAFKRMMTLAEEIVETDDQIDALEASLKDLKSRANHLKTIELPDLMAENGLSAIKLESGKTVEVSDFVTGSLPKDEARRKAAIDWLASNGGADLIKSEVKVEFSKTEHNLSKSLASRLRDEGFVTVEQESVHAQTLMAFAREKLKKGDEIPLDQLGLFSGRTVKIKAGKK